MPPSLRLCVCLILLATCSARPSWHKGLWKEEPAEERVNLHHTLKDLQHSATKAVKDVHKYFHQQLNTAAKTSMEKLGKPLATVVLGPAMLVKETLDALAGKRNPPPEETISSWCPSCLENDPVGQTQFHHQENPPKPCYEPHCHDGHEQHQSTAGTSSPTLDASNHETQSENPSFVSKENPHESENDDQTHFPPQSNSPAPCYEPDCRDSYGSDQNDVESSSFPQDRAFETQSDPLFVSEENIHGGDYVLNDSKHPSHEDESENFNPSESDSPYNHAPETININESDFPYVQEPETVEPTESGSSNDYEPENVSPNESNLRHNHDTKTVYLSKSNPYDLGYQDFLGYQGFPGFPG